MQYGMHFRVAYDHPIVYNGSVKIPTTPKDQGYLLLWQLQMTTTKNESRDT